jgi:hypothetical protein
MVALTAIAVSVIILVARDARATASSSRKTPPISSPDTLRTLAEKAGFKDLTECEQKLLEAAPIGEFANCESPDVKENYPSNGDQWPESRQIRAKLIRWLCVNESARELLDPKGIQILGAKIPDNLDLDFVSLPFAIHIILSRLSTGLSLVRTKLMELNLALIGPGLPPFPTGKARAMESGDPMLGDAERRYEAIRP